MQNRFRNEELTFASEHSFLSASTSPLPSSTNSAPLFGPWQFPEEQSTGERTETSTERLTSPLSCSLNWLAHRALE